MRKEITLKRKEKEKEIVRKWRNAKEEENYFLDNKLEHQEINPRHSKARKNNKTIYSLFGHSKHNRNLNCHR